MNINKINRRWATQCHDSLVMIDRMNTQEAYECGLITKEECDAIVDAFVVNLTIAMETKGFATAEELHPIPKSEIVKRFRKGVGQTKPK